MGEGRHVPLEKGETAIVTAAGTHLEARRDCRTPPNSSETPHPSTCACPYTPLNSDSTYSCVL